MECINLIKGPHDVIVIFKSSFIMTFGSPITIFINIDPLIELWWSIKSFCCTYIEKYNLLLTGENLCARAFKTGLIWGVTSHLIEVSDFLGSGTQGDLFLCMVQQRLNLDHQHGWRHCHGLVHIIYHLLFVMHHWHQWMVGLPYKHLIYSL